MASDNSELQLLSTERSRDNMTEKADFQGDMLVHSTGIDESTKSAHISNGFLSAPQSVPIRPLSPDAMSILSMDEFEQLAPSRLAFLPPAAMRMPAATKLHSWKARLHASWVHNLGLIYMLVAQLFGTLMNVTTRILEVEGNKGEGFHPLQILFVRMILTFILASSYMWWKKTPHFPLGAPEVRRLLIARGFAGFFGVFGMYYSLLYLPLADATVITFLAPGLACWACSILLKEPFTRLEQIGGMVSLAGVVLIARPTSLFRMGGGAAASEGTDSSAELGKAVADYDHVTSMQRLSAVGVALLGVLGAATAYTTLRWIGKRVHPLISVNYFSGFSTVISVVLMLVIPGVGFLLPTNIKDWGLLIFLGTCGFVMQYLLATALAYEKSSRATNMTYTQMLFALSFDQFVFGHTPGVLSIIGSSLILGSAIVVALQKSTVTGGSGSGDARAVSDEESQRGLISDNIESRRLDDGDEDAQEAVQMREMR